MSPTPAVIRQVPKLCLTFARSLTVQVRIRRWFGVAKKEAKKDEAPADGEGADGDAKPKKKLPIMLIAIAGAAVLVLGGGGAGAYFMFLAPKHPPAAADAKKAEKKKDKKDDKKDAGADKVDPKTQPVIADGPDGVTYFTPPEMTANIQSSDGHNAYLKLQVTFECSDDDTIDLLKSSMPRVNDVIQGFMNELRPDDLDGSAGDMMLKQEILRRINLVLAPHKIDSVLIVQKITT